MVSDDGSDASHRPQLTVYYRGNYAPIPIVGPPLSATAGLPVNLPGASVRASSTRWTQLSGPAAAVFTNPDIAATTTTFPLPGVYTLQLTTANSLAETSTTLVVTVAPPPTAFEQWLLGHFGSSPDPRQTGNLADPDQDGMSNLMEFATGSIPTVSDRQPGTLLARGGTLEFVYPRSHAAAADGLGFTVEWSDHLSEGWNSTGVSEAVIPDGDNGTTELWKAVVPQGDTGARFVRLRVRTP
jgi:hypothetical protein